MRTRSLLSLALTASAVVGIFLAAAPFAGSEAATTTTAADLPPVAVEDFVYPDADQIFAERGIRLKTGDGHILLADCVAGTGQVEVWARGSGAFCFEVKGVGGFLTLELPQVYAVKGNDYTLRVDMEADGEETSFDVAKNTWTPVGESADPEGRDHTLLEIHAAK
ncbi:hypothetical protein [Streptomyces sp. NPDC059863]|uniref:hypothetical protein n=1 Tax=unclassified Streptomyces TaxID=2593676 RepID=UPI00364A4338